METFKHAIKGNLWFYILTFASIALVVASFIVPPTGVIDPSVLGATGEFFAFGALGAVVKGIDRGVDAKVTHGSTTIEMNNDE